MGFTVVDRKDGGTGGVYAFRVLQRTFELGSGEQVSYRIGFYPEVAAYWRNTAPFQVFEGTAEVLPDSSIKLPQRAYCLQPNDPQHVEYVVRIEIDGQERHFAKSKCEESRAWGVATDSGCTVCADRSTPH